MSARIVIKKNSSASVSIRISDENASLCGLLLIGDPLEKIFMTVHMHSPAFGVYGNACGVVDNFASAELIESILGPIDFSRKAVAA